MLPFWLVVPAATLVMLVMAGYVIAIQGSSMPASRRRIRTATSLLIILMAPLFALAVSTSHVNTPQKFVLVWVGVMVLLALIIMLGFLDIANNFRLSSQSRAELARIAADALVEEIAAKRAVPGGAGGGAAANPPAQAPAQGSHPEPRDGQ